MDIHVLQVLYNNVLYANHSGGVRVQITPEYYILIEWHDAADVMPPSYVQAKN